MSAKTLRILCFGDSLTYGTTDSYMNAHPYSIALEKRLRQRLSNPRIEIITDGIPGDMVCSSGFTKRLKIACTRHRFDWVIILGGTNDLGRRSMSGDDSVALDIYLALQDAWTIALESNSKVLALTVPECHARLQALDDSRDQLNGMIKSHKESNCYHLDIFPKIPYHSLSEEDKERLWDDGLHMAPAGYDIVGNLVADKLLDTTSVQDLLLVTKSPQAKRRSVDSAAADKRVFEEESGSPRHISQGYVVVRKKELD